MKRLDAGTSGSPGDATNRPSTLEGRWGVIVAALTKGRGLRPVQWDAIERIRILDSRQHLVVCAPTNSGKSLLGHLILIDAVLRGQRAVLLEPLRALAQEQGDGLTEAMQSLTPSVFPRPPAVRISTGDYRLENELPSDGPPAEGELIVATPERLEAILRNPANAPWASTIGAVVVDEAHLVAEPKRGPTVELLVASMLASAAPPRIALLSATVGEPERLAAWLTPSQLVTSTARTPLEKQVWELGPDDDVDGALAAELQRVLEEPTAAAMVFVYRRVATETLATKLSAALSQPVIAYHSGMPATHRARLRAEFLSGRSRCLVTTTALAMGVNLPATHVFVRDTTFHGFGRLGVAELLQVLGRAGRGDRNGVGAVLLRPTDSWKAEELSKELRDQTLPPMRSSLDVSARTFSNSGDASRDGVRANLVVSCLLRRGDQGQSADELKAVLSNTLGGPAIAERLGGPLGWLSDPSRVLAYKDEFAKFHLTALGRAGGRAMLPLHYVSGLGQLVRDLLSIGPGSRLLVRWSPLDHLFLMSLLSDRTPNLRRFSDELANQIDGWLELRPHEEKSLLFSEWVLGSAAASKADELFGSLGLPPSRREPREAAGAERKRSYCAMLSAIVLDERSRGTAVADIERRWSAAGLGGVEEAWRDNALWCLSGHAALCEVRNFYHHLREGCASTPEQVRDTKRALGRMRGQTYDLLERLKYCSPLGPLLLGVREVRRNSAGASAGAGTLRALEAAGVETMQQAAKMSIDQLVNTGVQKRFAQQINAYLLRRMR
jgi:helicase